MVLLLGACNAQEPAAEPEAPAEADSTLGAKDEIDLQASGITVPPQDGDAALEVPFGSKRAAAEATLAVVLGSVVERRENDECPAGPMAMTEYRGVTLNFQDDRFVGWFATDPYVPDQTREEMLATEGVVLIGDSTLGPEFVIGDVDGMSIGGLFDGALDDSAVFSLWAGVNCFFR